MFAPITSPRSIPPYHPQSRLDNTSKVPVTALEQCPRSPNSTTTTSRRRWHCAAASYTIVAAVVHAARVHPPLPHRLLFPPPPPLHQRGVAEEVTTALCGARCGSNMP